MILNKELINICSVALSMILPPALNFLFLIFVAHLTEINVYGELAICIALVSVLTGFSDLGLRDFLLSKKGLSQNYSNGNGLFYPTNLFFVVLLFIIISYLLLGERNSNIILIFIVYMPEAYAYGVLQKNIFFFYQKKNELVSFSKIDSFFKSFPFLLKLVVLFFSKDLILAIASGSIFSFFSYIFWFYLRCIRSGCFFDRAYKPNVILYMVLSAWRLWLPFTISFFSFFLYFGFDRILIEALLGASQLAIYSAAASFISIGQIIVNALWSLYMPKISRGEDVFGQKKAIFLSIILGFFIFVSYQVFSFGLFGYFYPEKYKHSVLILSIMSFFFLFRFPNVVLEIYWLAANKYNAFVRFRVVCGFLNVFLSFLLTPLWGVLVPAILLVVSEAFLLLLIFMCEIKWKV
ncbi:MAG: oligosaccharide flippase family protein [Cloacibacterium sp.]|nr:oligosaccharide flippase family protein [Cloacibacterium sp.]